jgi:small-conductance mechanosensitive channel
MLKDLLETLAHVFTSERALDWGRAVMFFVLSAFLARLLGRWVRRLVAASGDPQRAFLAGRLAAWGFFLFGLAMALDELGFKLRVLLGAAGVFSVAAGFASQTTLSNLISGFFLFGEKPFKLGDLIEVDNISGEVISIDMMATKLRTMDNRFVRIPNELVIKTKVINHTRFPLRRLDLVVPIAHPEDFARVRATLLDIADKNTLCLAEPPPQVFIAGFGETTLNVQVWMWTRTSRLQELKVSVSEEIQRALSGTKRSTLGN